MNYDLYVVTDSHLSKGRSHQEVARLACEGGADIIQFRDKDIDDTEFLKIASEIREITRDYGVTFIVNDRLDAAIRSNADGIHVGQDDIPVPDIRKLVGRDFIIGCSVGSVSEAEKAISDGSDYIALSPIFDTSSKSDAGSGHGIEMLRELRKMTDLPIVAIGGINSENTPHVIGNGADGIAVISAVVSQDDIPSACRELKSIIKASKDRL